MYKVKDVMTSPVLTISPDNSVLQAADFMEMHNVGGLPVVEDDKLVGIITSKDIRFNHPNRIVADAMSESVIYCSPQDTIWDAAALMEQHKIERLPVLEKNVVVGIITKLKVTQITSQLFDPLTSLYSSEYIYQVAVGLLNKGCGIIVIFVDIDNFGEINKRYGHVTGDKYLKNIANILKAFFNKENNYLCRYGGDEFVVVTLKDLRSTINSVEKFINELSIKESMDEMAITLSIGICEGHKELVQNRSNYEIVEYLINKASLASTKAKVTKRKYIVA